jgi:hypothetical protein
MRQSTIQSIIHPFCQSINAVQSRNVGPLDNVRAPHQVLRSHRNVRRVVYVALLERSTYARDKR